MPPTAQFSIASPVDRLALGLFGGMGLFISAVAELYRRSRRKAAAYDREEALRETRQEKEFLANLLEHSSQPFAVGYPDGRLGRFNRAYERLSGYTAAELRTVDWAATLTPPEWRELEKQKLDALNRSGQPVRYEKEYVRKDGARVPIELFVHLVRDAEGKPEYYYSFIADITERKRAEQALRQSERRYRSFIDVTSQWAWVTDASGLVVEDIPALRSFTGQTYEDAKGTGWSSALHPEDVKRTLEVWNRAVAFKTPYETEYRMRRHDGVYRVLLARGVPILNAQGSVAEWVGTCIDITERKQAEGALRESEQRFRVMFEGHGAAMLLIELESGAIVDANKAAASFYGHSREQLRSMRIDQINQLPPEEVAAERQKAVDHVKNRFIFSHRLADGQIRFVEVYSSPVTIQDRPLLFSIIHDITERKRAEEELRSAHDELELRVRERTSELEVSNKALVEYAAKLERLNEELQDFAFAAAHDLQEPLRKIQTFTDMAMNRCAPALDGAGKEYLDRVAGSASRMRQLLHDLLQFARVATEPEPCKEIDLRKIVREAVDLFEEDLKRSGGSIEIGNIPRIEADGTQMRLLFQNLFENALKYRSEETPQIKVYAKHDGGRCEICVEDNGIGFDQQFAERIFKPFQRLHGRKKYGGTGMGLAICRKIVEQHGGSIRAESEPGKGSTFIIRLPVKQHKSEGV
jgi:PAS domain S-box-containing protein